MDNGKKVWNGMVRQLQDREADICGASLTITAQRSEAIDFSVGLVDDIFSLLMINPAVSGNQKPQIDLIVYLTVYSKETWLAILAVAMSFSIVYTIIANQIKTKLGSIYLQTKCFIAGTHNFFLSLIQRNSETGEKMDYAAEKLLLITISMVTFLLFSFYGGDLTATMTAGIKTPNLRTFHDVLDKDYKIYTQDGTAQYDFFRTAVPGSSTHQVYENALVGATMDEFLEEQSESPSNAAYFSTIFITIIHKDLLFLKNFDDSVSSQLAFGLQKDSEFKDILNYHINKLRQAGILKLLVHQWIKQEKPDDWSHRIFQDNAMPLGYENLFFPTMILLAGVSFGMFVLFVEKMLSTQRQI